MKTVWTNLIYEPIYNALIFIAQHITLKDVGLAVIVLTVIIRFVMMPLSRKSIISQYKMRALEPKLAAIRAKKLSKEEESRETFALYKTEKINPFSGCIYILIQLPILIALNYVFIKGIQQPEHLYTALSTDGLKHTFLGFIDITKPYFPLAILAGISQAVQAFLTPKPQVQPGAADFQSQLQKNLSMQTRYIIPILIVLIARKFSAAAALYWTVTNLFSIGQEIYFRRVLKQKPAETK